MTDKELAVQLYIAALNYKAQLLTCPDAIRGTVKFPTPESIVADIAELTQGLSRVKSD